jgi:exodeoxyribonuclease V alpha subunit
VPSTPVGAVTAIAEPVPVATRFRPNSPFSLNTASRPQSNIAATRTSPQAVQLSSSPKGEEIRGKVIRVVCQITESGFTVIALRLSDGSEIAVQGFTSQKFEKHDPLLVHGAWSTYKGKAQFKAEVMRVEMPREVRGVSDWFGRGAVKGVGKAMVAKLVYVLGDKLPDAMGNPAILISAGMKPSLAEAVALAWTANGGMGELEYKLGSLGLKPRQIVKVIERYGAASLKVVSTNPWKLVDIERIGFPTADRIAEINDLDMTCPDRLAAGLVWAMNECLNREGHCGIPEQQLIASAVTMLDVPIECITGAMDAFVNGDTVVRDELTGMLYTLDMLEAEEESSEHLAALMARSKAAVPRDDAIEAILRAERELGVSLDRDGGQFEAAVGSLCNAVSVITGGPGTGKSTTQAVIVKAHSYFGRRDERIQLGAPTGRAAKRLSETSGRVARTIHRMLLFSPREGGFIYNQNKNLELDVAIIDEFSMVDMRLFHALVVALPPDACLTLVGDADQLPSVGPGQVLRDLIDSETIPVYRLTRVHRQAAGSGIAVAAQRINAGLAPLENDTAVRGFSVEPKSDGTLLNEIIRIIRFDMPEAGFDPMKDVQVIAAMRKGDIGVNVLNLALKDALNPALDDGRTIEIMKRKLTVDDRVMQLRNDYAKGIYNGEVGVVTAIGTELVGNVRTNFLVVDFSGVEARYTADDIADLDLAYAATVHKVQGCEAPCIIFAAPYSHRRMLNRNLLYTGITRGRMVCRVVGHKDTINSAPQRSEVGRRHTGLRERLQQAMSYENKAL